jgi:hypothetical protein
MWRKAGIGIDDFSGSGSWVDELPTSRHGRENLLVRGWTESAVLAVKATGRTMSQADGATVYIQQIGRNRYRFIIENEHGQIVTASRQNVTRRELRYFAELYGWGQGGYVASRHPRKE